jgi:GNAT superfamily N-acetyltransferase
MTFSQQTPLTVRAYRLEDETAYQQLPHQTPLQALEGFLASGDQYLERLIAEDAGKVIGMASLSWLKPSWLNLQITVDLEHQHQGIETMLYQKLELLTKHHQPKGLRTFIADDDPASSDWASQHGFQPHEHVFESVLSLEDFDSVRHVAQVGAVVSSGIQFKMLDTLPESEHLERLYSLQNAFLRDIPGFEHHPGITPQTIKRLYLENQNVHPAGVFIALDGTDWVGLTVLEQHETGFATIMTGILPSHRRRGIAKSLKLLSMAYAQVQGGKQMRTCNSSLNIRMLALNRKLGYQTCPGGWWLEKQF